MIIAMLHLQTATQAVTVTNRLANLGRGRSGNRLLPTRSLNGELPITAFWKFRHIQIPANFNSKFIKQNICRTANKN